jgi:hypothetical protein
MPLRRWQRELGVPEPDQSSKHAHLFGRLASGLRIARAGGVEQVGPTQFRVQSESRKDVQFDVDLEGDPKCYCEDQEFEGGRTRGNCKHVMAAKVLVKHPSIIEPLTELVYQQAERNKELERTTRRKAG